MRWWILAASAAMVVVVAAMVLTAPRVVAREQPPAPPPPAETCPPLTLRPPLPASAALYVRGPAEEVLVDGHRWTPGLRVLAGRRALEVRAPSGASLAFSVDLAPFSTALLQVTEDPAALLPWLVGAQALPGEPALPAPDAPLLDQSARALSRGRWREAVELLGPGAPGKVEDGRKGAQRASALALAGTPERSPLLTPLLRAADQHGPEERARERTWHRERWNTATNRFAALALAMANDAPRLVEAARARLETLSTAFEQATADGDRAAQRTLGELAEQVTQALATDLVALRPGDCAWRARVQAALRD